MTRTIGVEQSYSVGELASYNTAVWKVGIGVHAGLLPSRIDVTPVGPLDDLQGAFLLHSDMSSTRPSARARPPVTGGHGQSGEAVDAPVVALGTVGGHGGLVLAPCPLVE